MRTAVGLVYGAVGMLLAIVAGAFVGVFLVLPFVVLPRGRRERYTMVGASWWGRFLVNGLLLCRPTVTGADPLPLGQGALYISNHRSWMDPLLLLGWTRAMSLSKAQIFWIPAVGVFAWLAGGVFVNRKSAKDRARARDEVVRLLRSGHRMAVFPEGTRSRDGELGKKIYLTLVHDCFDAGIPVVPCAVYGTERALPPGEPVAWPWQPCRFDIGSPVFPADHATAEAFGAACWDAVGRQVAALRREAAQTAHEV